MQTAMLALFPVGTILETTNSANPSTYIGGTWKQLDAGLTTITAGTYKETHNGTEDTYVFTAGSSNFTRNGVSMTGEAEHVITEGEFPTIHIPFYVGGYSGWESRTVTEQHYVFNYVSALNTDGETYTGPVVDSSLYTVGSKQPHNTIQPIYGVYRFRRIN